MALLTSCWFIIQTILIPDGFQKWFCLSFFIHPLILFFCRIFLWLKLLKECLLVVLVFPLRKFFSFCLYIFGLFRKCIVCFFSLTRLNTAEVQEEVEQYYDTQPRFNWNQITYSCTVSSAASMRCKTKLLEFDEDVFEETIDFAEDPLLCQYEKMEETVFYLCDVSTRKEYLFCSSNSVTPEENSNQCLLQIQGEYEESTTLYEDENMEETVIYPSEEYSLYSSNSFPKHEYSNIDVLPFCTSNSQDIDPCMDDFSPIVYASDFQLVEKEVDAEEDKEESDGFYKMYTERMRWFDVLNYERTCGISGSLFIKFCHRKVPSKHNLYARNPIYRRKILKEDKTGTRLLHLS